MNLETEEWGWRRMWQNLWFLWSPVDQPPAMRNKKIRLEGLECEKLPPSQSLTPVEEDEVLCRSKKVLSCLISLLLSSPNCASALGNTGDEFSVFFSLFIVMHIFLQLSWQNFSIFFILPNSSSVLLYKMYISPHNLCLPCQWTPEIWKVYPLLVALSPISENLPSRHCSN